MKASSSWWMSSSASASRSAWTDVVIENGPGCRRAVEVTAHAVGEAALLAQLGIEPRRELATQDLVQDQDVIEVGVGPSEPQVAGTYHRLRAPRAGRAEIRRRPGRSAAGSLVRGPPARLARDRAAAGGSSSPASVPGSTSPGNDDRRVAGEQESRDESSPDRPE